eukprot:scaffold92171_cov26-Prasinocladus_malaysianus.AAC.1
MQSRPAALAVGLVDGQTPRQIANQQLDGFMVAVPSREMKWSEAPFVLAVEVCKRFGRAVPRPRRDVAIARACAPPGSSRSTVFDNRIVGAHEGL